MDSVDLFISKQERLDLKRLLDNMECENNTDHIRKVKHSAKIQLDIMNLVNFKKENQELLTSSPEDFEAKARDVASFLFTNYTDIYRRAMRDEINYELMGKFLYVLRAIEDGKVDQHEGAVVIGKVLKELYLDSAVRHGENLDKKYGAEAPPPPKEPEKLISWKEYKSQQK